jgi:hypothetical protein
MLPSHPKIHFRDDPYLYNEINIFVPFSLHLVKADLKSFIPGLALIHIGAQSFISGLALSHLVA